MSDVFTPSKRSEVMSRIRSKGNKKTELALIGVMKEHGIKGWRRHQPLAGKPDFIFRRERVVVFVDGCFWHACPKCFIRPASNQAFWDEKIAKNRSRDRRVTRVLRKDGWTVLRIWEHDLKKKSQHRVAARLLKALAAAE